MSTDTTTRYHCGVCELPHDHSDQAVACERYHAERFVDLCRPDGARGRVVPPADQPGYDDLACLTLEQKAALPARFHTPVFDDCGQPNAWLCSVCWDEGATTAWPCAAAQAHGADVFDR